MTASKPRIRRARGITTAIGAVSSLIVIYSIIWNRPEIPGVVVVLCSMAMVACAIIILSNRGAKNSVLFGRMLVDAQREEIKKINRKAAVLLVVSSILLFGLLLLRLFQDVLGKYYGIAALIISTMLLVGAFMLIRLKAAESRIYRCFEDGPSA